jgi:hypothetical protein
MRALLGEASWPFQTREVQHLDGQHPEEGYAANSADEGVVGLGVGRKWFGRAEEASVIDHLDGRIKTGQ